MYLDTLKSTPRALENQWHLGICWAQLRSPRAPGDARLGPEAGFLLGGDGGKTPPMSWQLLSKGSSSAPGRPRWLWGAEYYHDHPSRGEGDGSMSLPSCSPQASPEVLQPGGTSHATPPSSGCHRLPLLLGWSMPECWGQRPARGGVQEPCYMLNQFMETKLIWERRKLRSQSFSKD